MKRLTIRLSDEKHERLRELAKRRKISMNKLIDELSTLALAAFDGETRFRARRLWARGRRGRLNLSLGLLFTEVDGAFDLSSQCSLGRPVQVAQPIEMFIGSSRKEPTEPPQLTVQEQEPRLQ
jgi:hypothetical protein